MEKPEYYLQIGHTTYKLKYDYDKITIEDERNSNFN